MAKPIDMAKFATKKELESHKKEVARMIKKAGKDFMKKDVKQDNALVKKVRRKKL